MENKIKALFYQYDNSKIIEIANELSRISFSFDYVLENDLAKLKSEIISFKWDILVIDFNADKSILDEIVEFISDLNSKINLLFGIENLNSDLIQLALKNKNSDVILMSNIKQTCLALIRTFERQKDSKQLDFTKKELIRSQLSQIEHEHFLNQIIESTTNPIFYKGTNGRYLGCNNAFSQLIGVSKDEIIGKTVFEISPKKLAEKYNQMDQEFFKNPETQQYEYEVASANGTMMDIMFYKTALKDEEGNIVGVLGHMFNISESKKLEREIKKEKEIGELILDTANEMYVMLNLNGEISGINKKACTVLGIDKKTAIGKSWINSFVFEKEKEKTSKVFNDLINGNISIHEKINGHVITGTDEKRLISWFNRIVRNSDGKIVGTLSAGEDITNKDRLEIELEESERKYQYLVENMKEGLGIVDLNEVVQFCNPAYDKVFGFETGGMVGKDLKDYVVKEDLKLVIAETLKRKENRSSDYKIRIKRIDNSMRIISVSSTPWRNENGEIIGAIGMFVDITAQEFTTKKLEKRSSIEQSIVNISSQFISPENFSVKLDNTLKELKNIIAAERYGILFIQNNTITLTNEQFDDGVESIGVDFNDASLQAFEYSLKILESFDFLFYDDITLLPDEAKFEKEFLTKFKIFNFLGIPFYSDSKLSGFVIINNIYEVDEWNVEDLSLLRTITEIIGHAFSRNKAEEQVKKLHLDIETKNNELEQVVYVTSHDIRSPVVNILGFSDEMIKALTKLTNKIFDEANTINNKEEINYLIEKDIPQILNFIRVSGQKIDKLLIALLKLSRLGRASINKVNIDMTQLVQNVVKTFEYQINQDNIKVFIDDLPDCYSDEVSVNQVLSNLIDNAIKYSSSERETIIKISAVENGDTITYCVSDNGIGIAETEVDKIFDVFYRINPENQSGEGMGLSLIKKTIDRVDGKISVGSELNKGTKFYITLEKQMN
jgi:PAS domain S-box-containing protein